MGLKTSGLLREEEHEAEASGAESGCVILVAIICSALVLWFNQPHFIDEDTETLRG